MGFVSEMQSNFPITSQKDPEWNVSAYTYPLAWNVGMHNIHIRGKALKGKHSVAPCISTTELNVFIHICYQRYSYHVTKTQISSSNTGVISRGTVSTLPTV